MFWICIVLGMEICNGVKFMIFLMFVLIKLLVIFWIIVVGIVKIVILICCLINCFLSFVIGYIGILFWIVLVIVLLILNVVEMWILLFLWKLKFSRVWFKLLILIKVIFVKVFWFKIFLKNVSNVLILYLYFCLLSVLKYEKFCWIVVEFILIVLDNLVDEICFLFVFSKIFK